MNCQVITFGNFIKRVVADTMFNGDDQRRIISLSQNLVGHGYIIMLVYGKDETFIVFDQECLDARQNHAFFRDWMKRQDFAVSVDRDELRRLMNVSYLDQWTRSLGEDAEPHIVSWVALSNHVTSHEVWSVDPGNLYHSKGHGK